MSTGLPSSFWYERRPIDIYPTLPFYFTQNIGKMIGTGVFSTRGSSPLTYLAYYLHILLAGSILKGVGSVGLSLIFWVIGYAFAGGTSKHLITFI
jgi:hypothetical protein